MTLNKLGKYIQEVDERNNNLFDSKKLKGISINKVLINTKADASNLNLKNYKIVRNNYFTYSYVTSRNGSKISIAYNDGEDCIVSSINPVFKVKDENTLLSKYLLMFFKRPEFDRYARFNSRGSAREIFSWNDLCDVELEIPPIEIQKKYVAIYEGLLSNLKSYEKGIDDLKLVCDGYIENLRKKYKPSKIKNHLLQKNIKNSDDNMEIFGISKKQVFIKSDSKTKGVDKNKYFICDKHDFAYSPIHINEGSIAYNNENKKFLVSPIYQVFKIIDEEFLRPEYLDLWFKRPQFIRYCRFNAFGSARDSLEWNVLCDYEIPIPPVEVQNNIINILNLLNDRTKYYQQLKEMINRICPILIKGAIQETNNE